MVPMLERPQMAEAVAAMRDAQEIVLASHINPDGDTLGSMIALGLGLRSLGKSVTLLSADGIPATLGFLPGAELVQTRTERRDFDLAVGLDAGDLARVGVSAAALQSAPILIDIDHHVTAGQFGQIRLLDSTAAATAEIIYDVLLGLGVSLDLPIAVNLLCALLTDTGSFRYRNVTPRTMALGGEMIRLGASPDPIAECVFENKPFSGQKMLGRALESLQKSSDGRIVWAHVTQADFAEFDATDEMTEGIVGAVRAVQGSDVALFLREMPSGKLRVSLRSRDPIDVSKVAAEFGGGGHRLASGCTLEGPLAEAEALLVATVARHIATIPMLPPPVCASEG
jgi:phosphoesterase RecJ-like protein